MVSFVNFSKFNSFVQPLVVEHLPKELAAITTGYLEPEVMTTPEAVPQLCKRVFLNTLKEVINTVGCHTSSPSESTLNLVQILSGIQLSSCIEVANDDYILRDPTTGSSFRIPREQGERGLCASLVFLREKLDALAPELRKRGIQELVTLTRLSLLVPQEVYLPDLIEARAFEKMQIGSFDVPGWGREVAFQDDIKACFKTVAAKETEVSLQQIKSGLVISESKKSAQKTHPDIIDEAVSILIGTGCSINQILHLISKGNLQTLKELLFFNIARSWNDSYSCPPLTRFISHFQKELRAYRKEALLQVEEHYLDALNEMMHHYQLVSLLSFYSPELAPFRPLHESMRQGAMALFLDFDALIPKLLSYFTLNAETSDAHLVAPHPDRREHPDAPALQKKFQVVENQSKKLLTKKLKISNKTLSENPLVLKLVTHLNWMELASTVRDEDNVYTMTHPTTKKALSFAKEVIQADNPHHNTDTHFFDFYRTLRTRTPEFVKECKEELLHLLDTVRQVGATNARIAECFALVHYNSPTFPTLPPIPLNRGHSPRGFTSQQKGSAFNTYLEDVVVEMAADIAFCLPVRTTQLVDFFDEEMSTGHYDSNLRKLLFLNLAQKYLNKPIDEKIPQPFRVLLQSIIKNLKNYTPTAIKKYEECLLDFVYNAASTGTKTDRLPRNIMNGTVAVVAETMTEQLHAAGQCLHLNLEKLRATITI